MTRQRRCNLTSVLQCGSDVDETQVFQQRNVWIAVSDLCWDVPMCSIPLMECLLKGNLMNSGCNANVLSVMDYDNSVEKGECSSIQRSARLTL